MKSHGVYGLITLDAHADFYSPSQSVTGEAADMDIALVTGRGPRILTDIDGLRPYVEDACVIHIGQRDELETLQYGSDQLSKTAIIRYGMDALTQYGIEEAANRIVQAADKIKVEGFWLHFDADVVHDEENPAVDYRLPGGLPFSECEYLLSTLLNTGHIAGISVSIYNPTLDKNGLVSSRLSTMLQSVLS